MHVSKRRIMTREGKRILISTDDESEEDIPPVKRTVGVEERASPRDISKCPYPGCDGRGSLFKRYQNHKTLNNCPNQYGLLSPPFTMSAVVEDAPEEKGEDDDECETHSKTRLVLDKLKCMTPGCDGMGNTNPQFVTHSTIRCCPHNRIPSPIHIYAANDRWAQEYLNVRSSADENVGAIINNIPEFDDLHEATKRMIRRSIKGINSDTVLSKLYHIYACKEGEEPILLYTGKTSGDKRALYHFTNWFVWRNYSDTPWIAREDIKETNSLMEAMDKSYNEGYKFRLIESPFMPNRVTSAREAIIIRGFIGKTGFAKQVLECEDKVGSDMLRDAKTAEVACMMMNATWKKYNSIMRNVPLIDLEIMSNSNWKEDYIVGSIEGGAHFSFKPGTVARLMYENATQLRCLICNHIAYNLVNWMSHMKQSHYTSPGMQGVAVQCKACRVVFSSPLGHPTSQYPCTSTTLILVRPGYEKRASRILRIATPVSENDNLDSDNDGDEMLDSQLETTEMKMEKDEDQHEEMEGDTPMMRTPVTAVSSEAAGTTAASSSSSASSLKCEFVSTEAVNYDNMEQVVDGLSQRFSQTVVSQSEGEESGKDEEEGGDNYADYDELTLRINGVPVWER